MTLASNVAVNGFFALILVRFGLLAAVVTFYVAGLFIVFPVTVRCHARTPAPA